MNSRLLFTMVLFSMFPIFSLGSDGRETPPNQIGINYDEIFKQKEKYDKYKQEEQKKAVNARGPVKK